MCPVGHRHTGNGICTFVGTYARGFIHGPGKLTCVDGRWYDGEWLNGRRAGKGTQFYLRDGEEGEPSRLYIGGFNSLYRIRTYTGAWVDGEREGPGAITYVNGDVVEGTFRRGQLHGTATYTFAKQPFTTGTFRPLVVQPKAVPGKKKKKGDKDGPERSPTKGGAGGASGGGESTALVVRGKPAKEPSALALMIREARKKKEVKAAPVQLKERVAEYVHGTRQRWLEEEEVARTRSSGPTPARSQAVSRAGVSRERAPSRALPGARKGSVLRSLTIDL